MFWNKEGQPEAREVVTCNVHASTQPAALTGVLQAVPRLLQLLCPTT